VTVLYGTIESIRDDNLPFVIDKDAKRIVGTKQQRSKNGKEGDQIIQTFPYGTALHFHHLPVTRIFMESLTEPYSHAHAIPIKPHGEATIGSSIRQEAQRRG